MLLFLQKAWLFVKKYYQLFLLVAGVVVGFILFKRKDISFVDDMRKIQAAHEAELKKIEEARAEERRRHEENLKKLQATLEAVQKQYEEQKRQLDAKKKAEIEDIVKRYKDDPTELAKKLSETAGFTVILPS